MFLDEILLRLKGQTRENLRESCTEEIEPQISKEIDGPSL